MKQFFQNIFLKMGVMLILTLLLLIPASMVEQLIEERMYRHEEAVSEVSSKHAGGQELTGPVLSIPYAIPNTRHDGRTDRVTWERGVLQILPETLNINGAITPKKRKRGIFEVAVYGTELDVKGTFSKVDFEAQGLKQEYMSFDKAYITVGVSDLKGLVEHARIEFDGKKYRLEPGVISQDVVNSGLHARCNLDSAFRDVEFDFTLKLNGSSYLRFAPIGRETNVMLTSTWKDPSFNGNTLPFKRKVSDDGFTAEWKALDLNRNYPQSWKGKKYNINPSLFGVDLILGVDVYQKSMRVAKYALLFIVLTFLVFFFVEVTKRILIHPIQYILVGLALVLFYVLMLAFSEQITFNLAYLLAAVMTVALICLYAKTIFTSWSVALLTASILGILYGFIFIIIQLQDYALLFGSLGVFAVLAVTMFFSRKIDWFEVADKPDSPEPPSVMNE